MQNRVVQIVSLLALVVLLLAACGARKNRNTAPAASPNGSAQQATNTPEPEYRFSQLISRDGIRPVYDPEFIAGHTAQLDDDQLVLGVEIDGEAKAYPISVLNYREMVNDELAGVPILATW